MIIDCIADLHGFYPELQGGDLLIVGGDLTARDTEFQFYEFMEWIRAQSYRKKVFIAGNHDGLIEKGEIPFCKITDGAEYLCDSGCQFEYEEEEETKWGRRMVKKTLNIWGSPWPIMPRASVCGWALSARIRVKAVWPNT